MQDIKKKFWLEEFDCFSVTGKDARKFLNGITTGNILNLENKVIKFCSEQNINIKLESSPRLLAFWNRPKLVWRILHDQNRTNSNITDEEIKNIELFIQFLSNYENSTKIGIIVSRNIEQALHPKSSIKLINTKFTINNEILYSSTRKFNLDKETFSIVFEG